MRLTAASIALLLSACSLPQAGDQQQQQDKNQVTSRPGPTTSPPPATGNQGAPGEVKPAIEKDQGDAAQGAGRDAAGAYVDAVGAALKAKGMRDAELASIVAAGHDAVDHPAAAPDLAGIDKPSMLRLVDAAKPDLPPGGPETGAGDPGHPAAAGDPGPNATAANPGAGTMAPDADAQGADFLVLNAYGAMLVAGAKSPETMKLVAGAALSVALEPPVSVPAPDALNMTFLETGRLSGKLPELAESAVAAAARAYSEFAARPAFEVAQLVEAQRFLRAAAAGATADPANLILLLKTAPGVVADHLADGGAKKAFVTASLADVLPALQKSGDAKAAAAFIAASAAIDAKTAADNVEAVKKSLPAAAAGELDDLLAADPLPDASTTTKAPATTAPPTTLPPEAPHDGTIVIGMNGNGTCPDGDFHGMVLDKNIYDNVAAVHADYWLVSCYNVLGQGAYLSSLDPTKVKFGNPVEAATKLLTAAAADKRLKPDIALDVYGYSYGGADALVVTKNAFDNFPAIKPHALVTVDPISHDCNLITMTSAACHQFPSAFFNAPFFAQIAHRKNFYQTKAAYLHSGASTSGGDKDVHVADSELDAGPYQAHVELQDGYFDAFEAAEEL